MFTWISIYLKNKSFLPWTNTHLFFIPKGRCEICCMHLLYKDLFVFSWYLNLWEYWISSAHSFCSVVRYQALAILYSTASISASQLRFALQSFPQRIFFPVTMSLSPYPRGLPCQHPPPYMTLPFWSGTRLGRASPLQTDTSHLLSWICVSAQTRKQ